MSIFVLQMCAALSFVFLAGNIILIFGYNGSVLSYNIFPPSLSLSGSLLVMRSCAGFVCFSAEYFLFTNSASADPCVWFGTAQCCCHAGGVLMDLWAFWCCLCGLQVLIQFLKIIVNFSFHFCFRYCARNACLCCASWKIKKFKSSPSRGNSIGGLVGFWYQP